MPLVCSCCSCGSCCSYAVSALLGIHAGTTAAVATRAAHHGRRPLGCAASTASCRRPAAVRFFALTGTACPQDTVPPPAPSSRFSRCFFASRFAFLHFACCRVLWLVVCPPLTKGTTAVWRPRLSPTRPGRRCLPMAAALSWHHSSNSNSSSCSNNNTLALRGWPHQYQQRHQHQQHQQHQHHRAVCPRSASSRQSCHQSSCRCWRARWKLCSSKVGELRVWVWVRARTFA
jgi:hypothetical protein